MKHVRELRSFWRRAWRRMGGGSPWRLRPWTRATRRPGQYTLNWDGRDDARRPVPRGRYRVCVEVNREHGPHHERPTFTVLVLKCEGSATRVKAPDAPELGRVFARYGPAGR